LSVHGPNGFVRFFKGSVGAKAAALDVQSSYGTEDGGELRWRIRNFGEHKVTVNVLDAYTGNQVTRQLRDDEEFKENVSLNALHGWYDLIVTVAEDPTFNYRLAGHVETGRDSFSDPALGGLVTLKG
jgi:phospholipase C